MGGPSSDGDCVQFDANAPCMEGWCSGQQQQLAPRIASGRGSNLINMIFSSLFTALRVKAASAKGSLKRSAHVTPPWIQPPHAPSIMEWLQYSRHRLYSSVCTRVRILFS